MGAVARVDAPSKAVGVVVGDVEGVLEVASPYDGEDGAEDLLLCHPSLRVHLEDGGRDEVALLWVARVFAQDPLALPLADIDIARDLLELRLAYDGTHPDNHALRDTDLDGFCLLDDPLENLVVDDFMDDGAGGGAALLARVAVG